MNIFKTLGNCCLVFLAVIAVCVSIAFGYYHFFVKDITIGTNYIGDQVPIDLSVKAEDLTQEQIDYYENRVLFQVNYYSNDKNNGIELQEMNLNYFTDYSLTTSACRSTGMQYIGDFETYTHEVKSKDEANQRVVEDFYYYDTTNMISWTGGKVVTQLNRNQELIIKIDNRAFSIKLTKEWREWKYKSKTFIGSWLGFDSYIDWYSDWGDVFYDVMNAVQSNSFGVGDNYITLDLSDYFKIKEYNPATGKFDKDGVTDIIKNYAVLKFHYDENGANKASQSLFKQIECNRNYGMISEVDTTYWQERFNYTLETDTQYLNKTIFNYRYSEVYDGYFISMTMDAKKLFAEMPRTKVNIYLDLNSEYLQSKEINVVGIDYNGFESLEIDTLTINGENQTFYVLDKGLFDTQLQTLKHTAGITFDFATNSINSEYVEVVL